MATQGFEGRPHGKLHLLDDHRPGGLAVVDRLSTVQARLLLVIDAPPDRPPQVQGPEPHRADQPGPGVGRRDAPGPKAQERFLDGFPGQVFAPELIPSHPQDLVQVGTHQRGERVVGEIDDVLSQHDHSVGHRRQHRAKLAVRAGQGLVAAATVGQVAADGEVAVMAPLGRIERRDHGFVEAALPIATARPEHAEPLATLG